MDSSEFLAAFEEGRAARRNGLLKSSNPYLSDLNRFYLMRTWEGGWEFEAHYEGCIFTVDLNPKQMQSIENAFLQGIFPLIQDSIKLDENSFLKKYQSLQMRWLPDRLIRIAIILPKDDHS